MRRALEMAAAVVPAREAASVREIGEVAVRV